jgi:hypothetical protein
MKVSTIFIIIIIIILLLYLLLLLFYGFVGFFKYKTPKKKQRIIVTLSTLPSRVGNLERVLNSIFENEIKPDIVYINIPKYSKREKKEYDIPENVTKLKNVKINIVDKDYGPITKLYPTLLEERNPDTIIICIDDDKEYDKKLIGHLVSVSDLYPSECVCVTGWSFINLGFFALPISLPINNIIKNVDILQCYNGVLYKRKFFDSDFKDVINCKECFTTDDILISKYLKYKNVSIKSVPYNFKHKNIDNKGFKLGNINMQNNNWIKCINKKISKIIEDNKFTLF